MFWGYGSSNENAKIKYILDIQIGYRYTYRQIGAKRAIKDESQDFGLSI